MIQKLPTAAIAVQPAMLINEQAIHVFLTYEDGRLCTMMHTHQAFYRLVQTFQIEERQAALHVMSMQRRQGYGSVLSIAPSGYRIWIDTRCKPLIELPQSA
jgi:hypothetical protein